MHARRIGGQNGTKRRRESRNAVITRISVLLHCPPTVKKSRSCTYGISCDWIPRKQRPHSAESPVHSCFEIMQVKKRRRGRQRAALFCPFLAAACILCHDHKVCSKLLHGHVQKICIDVALFVIIFFADTYIPIRLMLSLLGVFGLLLAPNVPINQIVFFPPVKCYLGFE